VFALPTDGGFRVSAEQWDGIVLNHAGPGSGSPIPRSSVLGYATGDLGISIAYFALGFFFLYYLTDMVGLPPAVAGTVVLIGKLWDGVNDPLIGVLADRTRSKRGRKRVYLLFGAVPFGLSFVLLWWLPPGLATRPAALLATVLLLLFATTYSLVGVPYQALVPVMTSDYDERTHLVAYKAVMSAIGAVLGGGLAMVVNSQTDVEVSLRVLAVCLGVVIIGTTLLAARAVAPYSARDTVEITPVPVRRYVLLLTERSVATLMGYKVLSAVATGVLTAALPFFADTVVGSGATATFALAAYTVVGAVMVPVWERGTHSIDKRHLMLVSSSLATVLLLLIGFIATTGSTLVFVAGAAMLGAAMSAYLVIPASLVPDLVDWYQHERGERHESVFFGLWMSVHQIGVGIAGFLLGACLSLFGYVGDADAQTPGAIVGVRVAFAVLPAVFLMASALLLQRYAATRAALAAAIDTGARS
jgi:GPH family glycoside/pentoside/hexuronide:cation symporter